MWLNFESWWMENKKRNSIHLKYMLDGSKHEVTIEGTKYYVDEIMGCDNTK